MSNPFGNTKGPVNRITILNKESLYLYGLLHHYNSEPLCIHLVCLYSAAMGPNMEITETTRYAAKDKPNH